MKGAEAKVKKCKHRNRIEITKYRRFYEIKGFISVSKPEIREWICIDCNYMEKK